MKKLERLDNSLFEKFETKKIKNLALCIGGLEHWQTTHGGGDCFEIGQTWDTYMYVGGSVKRGDIRPMH
jgi:hypothetical protein